MSYINFSKYHADALLKTEVFIKHQFDTSKESLYSSRRTEDIIVSRYVTYWILNNIYHFPAALIGRIFKKTHPSVLNGLKKIKKWEWENTITTEFNKQFPSTTQSPDTAQDTNKLSTSY